jgi:hypothetical protein
MFSTREVLPKERFLFSMTVPFPKPNTFAQNFCLENVSFQLDLPSNMDSDPAILSFIGPFDRGWWDSRIFTMYTNSGKGLFLES